MKYNGFELTEMLPENWDGRSREMLVWNALDTKVTKEKIIGYNEVSDNFCWMDRYGNLWKSCAEIPSVAEEDVMKLLNDNEKEILALKEENKALKEKIKSLQFERNEMANAVSHAVWKELMEKTALDNFNTASPGFRISIISQIVFDNVLKYKDSIEGIIDKSKPIVPVAKQNGASLWLRNEPEESWCKLW